MWEGRIRATFYFARTAAAILGACHKFARAKSFQTVILVTACIVWCGMIGTGMKVLWAYKSTPSSPGTAHPSHWPIESAIDRNPREATLILFAHPNCPCTRASIHELSYVATRFRSQVQTYVVFAIPDGLPDDGTKSESWRSAESIPGAIVIRDEHGTEARRFGAETSGHTLLYDKNGKLLFSGGITQVRGHEGDSFGRQRIISLLTTGTADRNDSPVFGCSMLGPHAAAQARNGEEKREYASD